MRQDVEWRRARLNQCVLRVAVGRPVVVRGFPGCLENLGPATGYSDSALAELGLDDIHPGVTESGRNDDALIKIGIPFELVERAKLEIGNPVYLAVNRIAALLANRRIVIEFVHVEIFPGDKFADVLRGLEKMRITLTSLEGSVYEDQV